MAMLNKIINHFYTILDNFNQRLIFCAIIPYLSLKKLCNISFSHLNYAHISIRIYKGDEYYETKNRDYHK